MVNALGAPLRRLRNLGHDGASDGDGTFWALRDVNFEVGQGEVVGIIGRNGAGKSTLLKVLSRITEPTSGCIRLRGRIASLLEVGTGFHPELTGRENVYLNGSILGMRHAEIVRKFDAIVAFAEVEKFIDTPVKRYSSGMYVRLAFAVAANLEPEILIVDEVLAVGDLAFQKKCLGKMGEVASHGRTILFVSHNMQAISALTNRCVIMHGGRVHLDAPTDRAVRALIEMSGDGTGMGAVYQNREGSADGNYISSARVLTSEESGVHGWGEPITFEITLHVGDPKDSLCFSFHVVDDLGRPVCHFWLLGGDLPFRHHRGDFVCRCEVPRFRLYMGKYSLTTYLSDRRAQHLIENLTEICRFEVTMQGIHREEYDWRPDACVYLEDSEWRINTL